MALDVGEKTIGTAFSDERQIHAIPGETILRQAGWKRDMAALRALIAGNQIGEIVVGLPLLPDGAHGIQAEKIEEFISVLRNNVRIPIALQDERYTTWEAEQTLLLTKRNRNEHKRVIDSLAASLILQSYLDRKQIISAATLEDRTEAPERETSA